MRRLAIVAIAFGALAWACIDTQHLGDRDAPAQPTETTPSLMPDGVSDASADAIEDGPAKSIVAFTVAAGSQFSCAATFGGNVYCWGDNRSGQLGRSSVSGLQSDVPVSLGLIDVGTLALGMNGTYAVSEFGDVWYWGVALSAESARPALPQKLSALAETAEIAAGARHACAIAQRGGVYCWGENLYGQLGPGASSDTFETVQVPGLAGAKRISARTSGHTCVVTIDDRVRCWGSNGSGELGDGKAGRLAFSREPVEVPLERIVEVSAGQSTTCAVSADGTLYCWGDGRNGQLGTGAHPQKYQSSAPVEVPGMNDVRSVSVGAHVCAITRDLRIACWGKNDRGQVGNGTQVDVDTPYFVPLDGCSASEVSVGLDHTCALCADAEYGSRVYCWGDNTHGQLGIGRHGEGDVATTPQRVGVFEPSKVQ